MNEKEQPKLDDMIADAQTEANRPELTMEQFKKFVKMANGISNRMRAKEKKQASARKKSKQARKSRRKNRK
jgi:hypothetical protein